MKLRFKLTQSDSVAVVFALQQMVGRMRHLATEKLTFEHFLSIRFVLNRFKVPHDTLRYLGLCRLMSCEEIKNALGGPERLFQNLMFVKMLKKRCVRELQNQLRMTFWAFWSISEHFQMLETSSSLIFNHFRKLSFLFVSFSLFLWFLLSCLINVW